jgi:hypothetical protein
MLLDLLWDCRAVGESALETREALVIRNCAAIGFDVIRNRSMRF